MDYSSWRHIVKRAVPRPAASKEEYELFFDKVFEVADRNPGDNVLRYALKRAATNFLRASRWELAEDFMLLAYRTNATVLSVVVDILVNRNATGADISKDKIKSFIEANLLRLCQNDKNGEVLWMLFLAKALRIQLDMSVVRDLTRTFDPACALLLCDLNQRGLLTAPLDTGKWDMAANPDGLRSEMWLYAYEAPLKGWSGVSGKYLSSDPGFKPLAARAVSFYDVERNVPRLHRRIASDVASARKLAFALAENIEEVDLALLNAEQDYEEFFHEFDNGEADDGY